MDVLQYFESHSRNQSSFVLYSTCFSSRLVDGSETSYDGQQQSKDELLYQAANAGNVDGLKALCRGGAGLEWIDRNGKTSLVVACMNPELLDVAKTLIELAANVNAYRPGSNAGTPLHHAAKRGLEQTVKLLLSHGSNALLRNDDCHTPLEIARIKGCTNVVRAIELCLRDIRVWVVILPCGSETRYKLASGMKGINSNFNFYIVHAKEFFRYTFRDLLV
ncbi:hypothetical protein REPUB_Repub12eG0101300 [Reevesia pubescens]